MQSFYDTLEDKAVVNRKSETLRPQRASGCEEAKVKGFELQVSEVASDQLRGLSGKDRGYN